MPLSKAAWMREYRKRRKSVIPKLVADETTTVIPKSASVIPNWYAGASDHFGVVKNNAKEFLISLGLT